MTDDLFIDHGSALGHSMDESLVILFDIIIKYELEDISNPTSDLAKSVAKWKSSCLVRWREETQQTIKMAYQTVAQIKLRKKRHPIFG